MSNIVQMRKKFLGDKIFFKNLITIALPIVIQNFIASSLNMVDTVMIGKVGETEIAAVGIANQYFFLFSLFIIGIYGGCGVFISQFWGKGDENNIKKIMGIGNILGIILSIIFTIIALIFSKEIIAIFNNDPKVIKLGGEYLKIVCISYIFTAISFNYSTACRCIHKATLPMFISAIAILCNTVFNYIFIFGHFGSPILGVKGAALATLIARVLECIILLIVVYKNRLSIAAKFNNMVDYDINFVKKVFRTIIPVVLNEGCWGLGAVVYSVVYGRIGTQAMASVQICTTIQNIFMVIIFGIANAATVLIGNKVGAGKEKEAIEDSIRISLISALIGIIIAILLSSTSGIILSFFNVSEAVKHTSKIILYIVSAILLIRVTNISIIVGILRGGGDAGYALKVEAFTMWFIGVPLAFIGAFVLKLPVEYVVALVTIEEVVKCFFSVKRLCSKKWIKSVVHEI